LSGDGDLAEEQRIGLGGVGGVHRFQGVDRAFEVAQKQARIALQVVEIGIVRVELQPFVSHLASRLRVTGGQEVFEQPLPQRLVGRSDPQHLLEGNQCVGRVIRGLVLLRQSGPCRQTEWVTFHRRLEMLHHLGRLLLGPRDLGQTEMSQAVIGQGLYCLLCGTLGLVPFGGLLVDTLLRVGEGLHRGLERFGHSLAEIIQALALALSERDHVAGVVVHADETGGNRGAATLPLGQSAGDDDPRLDVLG
jgi:hypothetical protein